MPGDWILWFEDLGQECSDQVGKKCANLGEMTRMGLRVPPGFALTLEAYSYFMSLSGAGDDIEKYLNGVQHGFEEIRHYNEASKELRGIVESKEMPEKMKEVILSYYRDLCYKCHVEEIPVSTRSAGAASHPGQYETYLNVIGESDLIEKITKVWASTFNPRSLSARKRAGVSLKTDPIGVAVVKMVDALAAGVLFTADPNTGDPSKMIIEANWGLGESVVGGEAMPDRVILDKESLEIVEKKLGSKRKYVAFKEAGVVESDTPPEKSESFCLTDPEAKEIGKMGKVLEEHFGVPQDCEWAIDRSLASPENIVLLQTRAEIIAQKKKPVDQVLDFMVKGFRV